MTLSRLQVTFKGEDKMKENKITFKVYGHNALFSDPITRVGGEKFSYQVPTYEALKGIAESIYWKPTFLWVIDKCRVMNIIQTQSKGIRTRKYQSEKNDLALYTYLANVEYEVEAHFEWNEQRPELRDDWNENKHWLIAKRMVKRGGRRDVFLGTRECQAYVEECYFNKDTVSIYDDIEEVTFGLMFHGYTYPDENTDGKVEARFWRPIMRHGIIEFIKPEECTIVKCIKHQGFKSFLPGENIKVNDDVNLEEEG